MGRTDAKSNVIGAIQEPSDVLLIQQHEKESIADKVAAGQVKSVERTGLMAAADPADMRGQGNQHYIWADAIPAPVQLDGRTRIFDAATNDAKSGPHVEVLTNQQLDRVETALVQTINDRHDKQHRAQFRPEIKSRGDGRFEEVLRLPIQPGAQARPVLQTLEQSARDLNVRLKVNPRTIGKFYERTARRLDRLGQLTRVAANEMFQRLDAPAEFKTPEADQRRLTELMVESAIQVKLVLTRELCVVIGMNFRQRDQADPINPFNNLDVQQQQNQAKSKETADLSKHIKTNVPLRGLSTSADEPPTTPAERKRERRRRQQQPKRKRARAGADRSSDDSPPPAKGGRGSGREVTLCGRGARRGNGRGKRGRGQSCQADPSQNPGGPSDDQDVDGSSDV